MSRPHVFHDQIADPAVAAALCEHREDREALLGRITDALQKDNRVLAAWLWGSLGRGEADDLSDLDIWIVVADAAVAGMGSVLLAHAKQSGPLLSAGEAPQNAPPAGGYLGTLYSGRHGLLQVDWYWEPASAITGVPRQVVLFDRLAPPVSVGDWQPVTGGRPGLPQETRAEQITGGIGFAWLMFSIAAKYLARDPASDMGLMLYPRPGLEQAAALLGRQNTPSADDWAVPGEPLEKVEQLRALVGAAEHLTLAANTQGMALPTGHAIGLRQYLDLVEGILRCHKQA